MAETSICTINMNKFLTTHEAADLLSVSSQTLSRWERVDKITCVHKTKDNQRRYDVTLLKPEKNSGLKLMRPTLAYARVSSHDQKEDLKRQEHMLSLFCASKGWEFELLSDLGSGLNYHKI